MLIDALDSNERLEHWGMNGGKTVLEEAALTWPKTRWGTSAIRKQAMNAQSGRSFCQDFGHALLKVSLRLPTGILVHIVTASVGALTGNADF